MSKLRNSWGLSLAAVALLSLAISVPAHASNLVTNGSFESNGGNGQLGYNTSATGWSVPAPSGSYTLIFAPGTADGPGSNGQYGNLQLWGPGNGSANGLPPTSPDGGYYIAQDSAFQPGAISQTINGLTAGDTYTVSFWWAAAQQYTFTGPTFDNWQVSLGSQTQNTSTLDIASHGFSGWQHESFTYTANSSSEVLSFFANGGPPGVPPFALLDGITLVPTPEADTLVLLGTGLLGLVGFARHKYSSRRG